RFLRVGKPVAAAFDSAKRRAIRSGAIDAGLKKTLPVVRRDPIERFNEIVESVWFYLRRTTGTTVKYPAKIIERLTPLRLLADHRIRLEPDQQAFVVK